MADVLSRRASPGNSEMTRACANESPISLKNRGASAHGVLPVRVSPAQEFQNRVFRRTQIRRIGLFSGAVLLLAMLGVALGGLVVIKLQTADGTLVVEVDWIAGAEPLDSSVTALHDWLVKESARPRDRRGPPQGRRRAAEGRYRRADHLQAIPGRPESAACACLQSVHRPQDAGSPQAVWGRGPGLVPRPRLAPSGAVPAVPDRGVPVRLSGECFAH